MCIRDRSDTVRQFCKSSKNGCASILKKHVSLKHNEIQKNLERSSINSIRRKLIEHDLIFCKPDKGNTIKIFKKQEYIKETLTSVSYTHLDVYKRQGLSRAP